MSSLLEVFGILFQSDADNVKRGAEEAGDAVDDLEGRLEDTDAVAEKIGDSFLGLTQSAKRAIVSVLGLSAVSVAAVNAAQQTDDLAKFSRALEFNAGVVSAWSEAVIRSGGTAEGFRGSLGALQDQMTEFTLTGSGAVAEVFARLGIAAFDATGRVRSALDVLPELAEVFERLDVRQARNFGQRLGLDQSTILLLQQGRREVEALIRRQEALGVTTREDTVAAEAFKNSWADIRQVFNRVLTTANNTILPVLTKAFNGIRKFVVFLRDNEDLVTGFFVAVAGIVTALYLPAITKAAIATVALLSPFVLLTAAVVGLGAAWALIYEDIVAFQEGQDSLIGAALEKWPQLGDAAAAVGDVFRALRETVSEVASAVVDIPNDSEGSFKRIASALSRLLATLRSRVPELASSLGDFFVSLLPAKVQEGLSIIKQAFEVVLGGIGDAWEDLVVLIGQLMVKIATAVKNTLPDLKGVARDVKEFLGITSEETTVTVAPQTALAGETPPEPALAPPPPAPVEPEPLASAPVLPIGRAITQGELAETLTVAQGAVAEAETNPLAGQTATSIVNNASDTTRSVQVSVGTVAVDARGADSKELAANVGDALLEQMELAIANFSDGVAG